MSEQQQIHPQRAEETVQQPAEMSRQALSDEIREQILDDNIDISDLVEEHLDIAKVFRQKGGQ